jgi:hypothetical protein
MPKTIPTSALKLEHVPQEMATWRDISVFALSFDPHEMGTYGAKVGDLKNSGPDSSLMELRAHLYVEQRRWHHFGEIPDKITMQQIRKIIKWIRNKAEGSDPDI